MIVNSLITYCLRLRNVFTPISEKLLQHKKVALSIVIVLIILLTLANSLFLGDSKEQILQHLDNVTVLVDADKGSGTGTIFSRKDEKGNTVHFVWTAGHVIERLEDLNLETMEVKFKNLKVAKMEIVNGVMVKGPSYEARVIKFSNGRAGGNDLALLELVDKNVFNDSIVFGNDDVLRIGTPLYHVGCLHGVSGYNSLSEGIMSNNGINIKGRIYDQTTTVVFPGSSGGGIFDTKGRYVGMVTMMSAPNLNFVIPIRRIHDWAEENDLMWALNKHVPLPKASVRYNMEKDSELDSSIEKFAYSANKNLGELNTKIKAQEKIIADLKKNIELINGKLHITNSPPAKTNSFSIDIFRLFGGGDDDDEDDDSGDE